MWEELENALAWYQSAPNRYINSAKQDLSAAAEWIWTVLQGDFADEEQTTAQIVTGTVISMAPFVDQLCDIRDLVANCKKINEDSNNNSHWIALTLTLIGLFPCLGSLAKGCLKILFGYARKGAFKLSTKAVDSDLWVATRPWVEAGIRKLNQHLDNPIVRKAIAALKIDNIYKYLADKTRELAGEVNVGALLARFDELADRLKELTDLIEEWGSSALVAKVKWLLKAIKNQRDQADKKLAELVKPVQDWLNRLAQRLEVEHRQGYRASTNAVNPHNFKRPTMDDELAEFKKKLPEWVDETKKIPHRPNVTAPKKAGWPDISDTASKPLEGAHQTFKIGTIEPMTYPEGTVLCRVVDPNSFDNSISWMTKADFDKLRSKEEWRRKYAVWSSWNSNGEYVTYTVPKGGLNAWEGVVASQQKKGTDYVLEGGARQIVIDPKDLAPNKFNKREFTGWGYDEFGKKVDLIGVPILQNNIFGAK